VFTIQQRLYELGYEPGPIDGELGSMTTEAIRRFQESAGFEGAGLPDDRTVSRLMDDDAPRGDRHRPYLAMISDLPLADTDPDRLDFKPTPTPSPA